MASDKDIIAAAAEVTKAYKDRADLAAKLKMSVEMLGLAEKKAAADALKANQDTLDGLKKQQLAMDGLKNALGTLGSLMGAQARGYAALFSPGTM
jgi:phage-related protein